MNRIYSDKSRTFFTDTPCEHLERRTTLLSHGGGQTARRELKTTNSTFSLAEERLRRKYQQKAEETKSAIESATRKHERHLRLAKECESAYTALIDEHEKLLLGQERLEVSLDLVASVASLAVSVGKDVKFITKARLDARAARSVGDPVASEIAEYTLEWVAKRSKRSVARTLKTKAVIKMASITAEKVAAYVVDRTKAESPFLDAASILWGLSPFGSSPTRVAKSALRLYGDVDLDQAKADHKKMIEDMKFIRTQAVANHRIAAQFLDWEINRQKRYLDFFIYEDYKCEKARLLH